MVSSGADELNTGAPDAGFATPAAVVVSLALALIASAVTLNSIMELRLARADLDRVTADYALAGAQQAAVLALLSAKQDAPLRWTQATTAGPVTVLAEPQAQKLTPVVAASLGGVILARFALADPAAVSGRLRALPAYGSDFDVETADTAPLWRACARSMISPYGAGKTAGGFSPVAPAPGPIVWRIGETWRVRVAASNGWVDDRIVRFTGDASHPAAVVERRLRRTSQGESACDKVLAGAGV